MRTQLTPDTLSGQQLLLAPEVTLLPDGPASGYAVLITDGVFTEVGPAAELTRRHSRLAVRHLDGQLLMPGFVDAHHHLTQSFGKALAFGEPSEIFRRVWVPLESRLDEESAYLAAKLSALESLRGGFTTVADAGTRAGIDLGAVADATTEAGLRCVLAQVGNDLDPDPRAAAAEAEAHLAHWSGHRLVHASLAVSIPEAASDAVLRRLSALSAEAGAVFQVHVNEHLAAVERSLVACGRRPLEQLHHAGALGPQLLAAHATLLTPRELHLLAETGAAVSYNPVASAWKGNAVAPATAMAAAGIRFGLGTDGTRGDAFRLMDAAEFAQRLAYGLASGDSSCGAGWTWLEHATAGSADAVGLGQVTGRIAAGLAADYLLVDLTVPELRPSHDLTWELVRLANRDQITAVVVEGKLRLWRGWPTEWDGPALVSQAAKAAEKVLAEAEVHRVHPTAAEHRRNGAR
ncbi:amidohydrolase family protein [Amycolatopsis benzoatilytica]|uniref:amidohydrolase family protein n=1 Tax=Amycolatopsis benzoatilytica TaxID=346045 RepID=UPI000379F040|nr:amidohydrolase family protein [Amycolatopsis benzoatilytica]